MGSNCCKGDAAGGPLRSNSSIYTRSRAGASLDDRFAASDDAGGVRLTVSAARTGDSGVYTLQASNAAGTDAARVRLEVSADEAPTGDDPPNFLRRLQDLTVKVGTRTRFLVEILSSTECKVTWYRNERRLMEAERIALVRDGHFWCADVSAVSVDDAGRWTCTAENAGGRASCSAHLNVLVPKAYKRPEFVEELRALLTEQGTVSLECKVVGVPTPVLRWFKDSREIKAGDVFALTANAEDPTSLGTYTCEAVNCMGRAYSSSKVHVVGRGSREGSAKPTSVTPEPPPIFTKELEPQTVRICEPLALSCQLVVPPWPRAVVWYNKDGKLEPGDRYHILEDGVGGYLVEIPSAEWCDEGEWKCVATSSGGRVGISTTFVTMDVPKNYRKPRFMENLQAVLTEEGLVSFECKVVGFPTPVLSWFKDGQELKPGDVYQLTGTNSLGSYCCIARNCMGHASSSAELTVEDIQNQLNEEEKLQLFSKNQAPKFVQGLKSVEAKIDEPFRFTIKVQIPPEPSVVWYRDDQPIDESTRCHLGKEDKGLFFLDIQNLEFFDQAEWKCVAMNDFGHSVTSCFLKLFIPRHYKKPRFLENLQAILSDEGAVNLECKVIGVPQPILKWYKDGEELKPGDIHRIISGQDGTCCLGTYTCEARNCMGIAASSASLLGFDDSMKAKKKKIEEPALQRNLSLSTIHEERTSQMYDTPVGDITLDDKGEISFSFDGKSVSVSLYETPDLTEEEALQIVEMYADQLSENVTEHNVVELPPLRFVKETSTSGNLLMEAIIIDVSPDYFVTPEEDLRTEADVEDISIADENAIPQLSLDTDLGGEDYLEKTMALLSDEKSDVPKKMTRKKSDSVKSGDDFFSLSREQSLSEEKRDDDTQMSESFASARSSAKVKSKSSKPSDEEAKESSEFTKTILFKEETQKHTAEPDQSPVVKLKRERRSSRGSRRSSSGSEKSLSVRSGSKEPQTKAEPKPSTPVDSIKPAKAEMTSDEFKIKMTNVSTALSQVINDVQIIERDIILKSELMSSAATASRSLEIINSLIAPLSEIHSIADAAKECASEAKEVISTLFNSLPQPLKALQQSLTIVEKCIDVESDSRTLVKRTCVAFIASCGSNVQMLISDLGSVASQEYLLIDEKTLTEIDFLCKEVNTVLKYSTETVQSKNLLSEASELKLEEVSFETKHLRDTQKAVFELRSPLNSLLCIAESADSGQMVDVTKVKHSDVILTDMSASIQDLQTALVQIESLSVKESTTSLHKYNTEIIETVMESILKLRNSFEQLSTETRSEEDKQVLKKALASIKHNLGEISTHIDIIEKNVGTFDVLQSDNKLEVLQKMAQILIALENNLPRLEVMPEIKTQVDIFHKNLTKVLENVIESNDAKKYFALMEICDAVNRVNSSVKNIDVDNMLALASLSNTVTIIQGYFVKNIFESELNCSILSNITDVLLGIQEAISHAEEVSMNIDSEHIQDISLPAQKGAKAKLILEHIEHTIVAISNIKAMETTKELNVALTPVLETICPVLEELKRSVASARSTGVQEEHVSEMSEMSLVQTLATPICELNQNIVVLNQLIVENIDSIKETSEVLAAFAEPLHELHTTLEVLQQDVISQYGEDVTTYDVSVNLASAVQNLQSCIIMIQQQEGVEAADDMSTLEDISGIKTTADTIPSDRFMLPTAEETTVELSLEPLKEELAASVTAMALQSLNEHITVLQTPEIIDALDSLSEVSSFTSLKSIALGLGELHAGIEEILHPVVMENSNELSNLINLSKLTAIAEPMQELQQSLSILDKSNIPVYEHILEIPAEKIHSVLQTITKFKVQLDRCIHAVFPAMETADKTIEISNKVETLREVCEHLKDIISTTKIISHEITMKQEFIALEGIVDNLLDATDVSKGIKIENVKLITEELYQNIITVQEEIIQFTPRTPEILSQEAELIQALDEIESNIAVLEQYEFVDLSRASDITTCTSPQWAMELESESLLQMDDIVENAVNVVQDSTQDTPIVDLMIIEDFFKTCKNQFTILRCLMTKQLSHKKIIRILQEFSCLQSSVSEFKLKRTKLNLSEDIDSYLTTFLIHAEDCLKNVQQSLIKIVQSQSEMLIKQPINKLEDINKALKQLPEGKISPQIAEVAKRFGNVINAIKPCIKDAELAIVEELIDTSTATSNAQENVLTDKMEEIVVFIEEQSDMQSLDDDSKQILAKMLTSIQKHEEYKDAVGTGKTLIILKCLSECSDVLQETILDSKTKAFVTDYNIEDSALKSILTEMLEPLHALHSQLISVQEQILSGVEDDSISVDIPSTESLVHSMAEIYKEIQLVESGKIAVDREEISLIMEVDKEIHTIQDSIRSMESVPVAKTVKKISRPIDEIEKSLQSLLTSEKVLESKSKLPAGKAKELIQHIDQYVELIEIIQEISTVIKIEDMKETATIAHELRENITEAESAMEVKVGKEGEVKIGHDQVDLAQRLHKALSAFQLQVLYYAQEIAPALGVGIFQQIAQVTSQLQVDLVAVTGEQVALQAPATTEFLTEVTKKLREYESRTELEQTSTPKQATVSEGMESDVLKQVNKTVFSEGNVESGQIVAQEVIIKEIEELTTETLTAELLVAAKSAEVALVEQDQNIEDEIMFKEEAMITISEDHTAVAMTEVTTEAAPVLTREKISTQADGVEEKSSAPVIKTQEDKQEMTEHVKVVETLKQHIAELMSKDIIEVIEKISEVTNTEKLKQSVKVAQELFEIIEVDEEGVISIPTIVQVNQAQIAHQLQAALSELQIVSIENSSKLKPVVGEDAFQKVVSVVTQLQDDLNDVTKILIVATENVPIEEQLKIIEVDGVDRHNKTFEIDILAATRLFEPGAEQIPLIEDEKPLVDLKAVSPASIVESQVTAVDVESVSTEQASKLEVKESLKAAESSKEVKTAAAVEVTQLVDMEQAEFLEISHETVNKGDLAQDTTEPLSVATTNSMPIIVASELIPEAIAKDLEVPVQDSYKVTAETFISEKLVPTERGETIEIGFIDDKKVSKSNAIPSKGLAVAVITEVKADTATLQLQSIGIKDDEPLTPMKKSEVDEHAELFESLKQHITEFVSESFVEVIENITKLTNTKELNSSLKIAQELCENISAVEIGFKDDADILLSTTKANQTQLTQQLQTALSQFQILPVESLSELSPMVGENDLRTVLEVISQLQDDLKNVNEITIHKTVDKEKLEVTDIPKTAEQKEMFEVVPSVNVEFFVPTEQVALLNIEKPLGDIKIDTSAIIVEPKVALEGVDSIAVEQASEKGKQSFDAAILRDVVQAAADFEASQLFTVEQAKLLEIAKKKVYVSEPIQATGDDLLSNIAETKATIQDVEPMWLDQVSKSEVEAEGVAIIDDMNAAITTDQDISIKLTVADTNEPIKDLVTSETGEIINMIQSAVTKHNQPKEAVQVITGDASLITLESGDDKVTEIDVSSKITLSETKDETVIDNTIDITRDVVSDQPHINVEKDNKMIVKDLFVNQVKIQKDSRDDISNIVKNKESEEKNTSFSKKSDREEKYISVASSLTTDIPSKIPQNDESQTTENVPTIASVEQIVVNHLPKDVVKIVTEVQVINTEHSDLIQHVEEFISNQMSEVVEELSKSVNAEQLKESVSIAKELREVIAAVATLAASEDTILIADEARVEQAKLAQKLQDALSTLQTQVFDSTEDMAPAVNTESFQRVHDVVTHLQEDLKTAIVCYVPDKVKTTPDLVPDISQEKSMRQLEDLLQEVSNKINIPPMEKTVEDSEKLRDTLDEVQTVIIKLKRDCDLAGNDTLNETLEDLECSVRSVQLQINEDNPPELLQEACATLQLLANNMTEIQDGYHITETKSKINKSEAILQKCSYDVEETVKLLNIASKLETTRQSQLTNIVSSLNTLKDVLKSLRLNFLSDAETLIEKGVEVIQNLDQIEEKVFSLEKDVESERKLTSVIKENIISAVHSVYGSISNMRSTILSIQKQYMYENYGIPSECFLHSIRNVSAIKTIDEGIYKSDWKKFSKLLRNVLNHFEDVKFYINLDKTARLPSDAAFTKIILQELNTNIVELILPFTESLGSKIAQNAQQVLQSVHYTLTKIESNTTLEVKEKMPIFKKIASQMLNLTNSIKSELESKKQEHKDKKEIVIDDVVKQQVQETVTKNGEEIVTDSELVKDLKAEMIEEIIIIKEKTKTVLEESTPSTSKDAALYKVDPEDKSEKPTTEKQIEDVKDKPIKKRDSKKKREEERRKQEEQARINKKKEESDRAKRELEGLEGEANSEKQLAVPKKIEKETTELDKKELKEVEKVKLEEDQARVKNAKKEAESFRQELGVKKLEEEQARAVKEEEDADKDNNIEKLETQRNIQELEFKKLEEDEDRVKTEQEVAVDAKKEIEEAERARQELDAKKLEDEQARVKKEQENEKKAKEEKEEAKKVRKELEAKKLEEKPARVKTEQEVAVEKEETERVTQELDAKKLQEEQARVQKEQENAKKAKKEKEEAKMVRQELKGEKLEEEQVRVSKEQDDAKKEKQEVERVRQEFEAKKLEEELASVKTEQEVAVDAKKEKKEAERVTQELDAKKLEEEQARVQKEQEDAIKAKEENEEAEKVRQELEGKKLAEEQARVMKEQEDAKKEKEEAERVGQELEAKKLEENQTRVRKEQEDAKKEKEEAERVGQELEAKKLEENQTRVRKEQEDAKKQKEEAVRVRQEFDAKKLEEEQSCVRKEQKETKKEKEEAERVRQKLDAKKLEEERAHVKKEQEDSEIVKKEKVESESIRQELESKKLEEEEARLRKEQEDAMKAKEVKEEAERVRQELDAKKLEEEQTRVKKEKENAEIVKNEKVESERIRQELEAKKLEEEEARVRKEQEDAKKANKEKEEAERVSQELDEKKLEEEQTLVKKEQEDAEIVKNEKVESERIRQELEAKKLEEEEACVRKEQEDTKKANKEKEEAERVSQELEAKKLEEEQAPVKKEQEDAKKEKKKTEKAKKEKEESERVSHELEAKKLDEEQARVRKEQEDAKKAKKEKEEAERVKQELEAKKLEEEQARVKKEEDAKKEKETTDKAIKEKEEAERVRQELEAKKLREDEARLMKEQEIAKKAKEAERVRQELEVKKLEVEEARVRKQQEDARKEKEEAERFRQELEAKKLEEEQARVRKEQVDAKKEKKKEDEAKKAKEEAERVRQELEDKKQEEEKARVMKEQVIAKKSKEAERVRQELEVKKLEDEKTRVKKEQEDARKEKEEAERVRQELEAKKLEEEQASVRKEQVDAKKEKKKADEAKKAKKEAERDRQELEDKKQEEEKARVMKELEDAKKEKEEAERVRQELEAKKLEEKQACVKKEQEDVKKAKEEKEEAEKVRQELESKKLAEEQARVKKEQEDAKKEKEEAERVRKELEAKQLEEEEACVRKEQENAKKEMEDAERVRQVLEAKELEEEQARVKKKQKDEKKEKVKTDKAKKEQEGAERVRQELEIKKLDEEHARIRREQEDAEKIKKEKGEAERVRQELEDKKIEEKQARFRREQEEAEKANIEKEKADKDLEGKKLEEQARVKRKQIKSDKAIREKENSEKLTKEKEETDIAKKGKKDAQKLKKETEATEIAKKELESLNLVEERSEVKYCEKEKEKLDYAKTPIPENDEICMPKQNGDSRSAKLERLSLEEQTTSEKNSLRELRTLSSEIYTDVRDEYDFRTSRRKNEDKDKPRFIDHNHRDYTMEFAKPSGYREKSFDDRSLLDRDSYGRSPMIYKAHTIVLDSQLRSSLPPLPDVSRTSESERLRSELRHKSKGISEARSVISEKRSSVPRDIKRKPVFSTYLTDRTAVEGSRVKLTCSVLSSSDPTIVWYKNGVILDNKLKYRTKFVDGLITLEVLNAVPGDSAEYSCTVENDNGSVNSSANLKVYPSFEASPIPPTFTRSIRDTYHLAENELVLECRIRGQPLPTISWFKDDKPISTNERYQAYYLADGVCRLAISHPTPEDSGKYTCKAENSVWSDQITHVVNYSGKESRLSPNLATIERSRFNRAAMESRRPHFTNVLSDYKVARGGTIGLQVEIRGCPTRVEWLREGLSVTEMYRNARTFVEQGLYTLALTDVTEKESGMYTCRAWSSHGTVDMNAAITVVQPNEMEGRPAIIVGRPEKDVLISVGEDINISFRVQGEPKPKVIFMKGIRDITNSQRVCKMTSDDYVKFTVKRSVISDAGTYCILARNAYGCDRAFVTVVVRQRASSENLISDWTYPIDDSALSIADRQYKSVPDRIPGEPSVVDGGNNWVSIAWSKPENRVAAPVLAYRIESWLLGKEGGARWVELGITPLNTFDAFNLKQGEEYHFRVTPRNRYGWGESVQTSSPIGVGLAGDRPEFVDILPGQLKVLLGETASLSCSVSGKPTPEVVWMKNGHEIDEETRMKTSFNGYNCCLTIKDIAIEDEARYSCEATNTHGRASTYARLAVVTDRMIWEADAKLKRERSAEVEGEYPPQFTMRLRDRRVQATYPVRLTCQVVGSPAPTLTWFKDGEELTLDCRHTSSQDEHFHTLEIAPTTLEDGGMYEALARNGSGAVSCRCCLVVDKGIRAYVAPEFCCGLEPLYRLSEGEELRISAVIEAYPSVGVTWYRDGVRLRPSRRAIMTLDRDGQIELALASVTPRDSGVYTCTASNEVGRASTSGKVDVIGDGREEKKKTPPMVVSPDVPYSKEPMFIRKPRSSEAREGDTVIIACEVIGDPKPDVYWLRDFLKPDYYRDATHFKRVGAGPEYRFEIPHAKLDYTGAYSVVARNVHGEAKAIISLQILARDPSSTEEHNIRYGRVDVIPRFDKNLTDLLCYDGDAIEFECRVSGHPEPYIRWLHYTEVIRHCSDFETSFEDGTARLKIKQVTAEDEGTYACEASNSLGKASCTACLVVYPPGEPNTLSQRLRRPPALLSGASTPRSTPRSTPARSVSRTPGPDPRRLCSPSRQMAPKFYTYPYNKVAEEGDHVVIQCAVRGLPVPWTTWDKDGVIITPSSRITIREKDDMLRILEIEEVTVDDVGLYRITLENDYGRVEACARLEVISHEGKFHAGVRSYSASPRRALRRAPSAPRQD